jgi:hypothetical protein
MDNSQYYKFTMTPTTAATGKQITITNTKDVNNFVYPLLYSLANLSFNTVYPIPTSGLLSWYDVNDSTTITMSGSFIQKINDKYGSYNLTDGTPSSTIVTELGKTFYRNSEITSPLTSANALISNHNSVYNAATYFVTMRFSGASMAACSFAFLDSGGNNNFRWLSSSLNKIGPNMQHATSIPLWTLQLSKWYVFEFEYTNDVNNVRARIFNHDSDTAYRSAPGQPAYPPLRLTFGSNVDIGEVVYYNSALTSTNSNTVCNYLKNKWCI